MKDVNDSNTWSVKVPVFFALIGLFGGFVAWGTMTQIAGAIISPGRIEVDQNRQVVQHQMGGTVAQILVVEGDIVKAGDVLLRLDDQQLQSQLAITEGQLFELMARRGRLSAERDSVDTVTFDDVLISVGTANPDISELIKGQTNLFFARRDSVARETEQLGKREAQIGNQIAGIDAQKTSLARQLELIQQELEAQETLLDRGLAQAGTVLALHAKRPAFLGNWVNWPRARQRLKGVLLRLIWKF